MTKKTDCSKENSIHNNKHKYMFVEHDKWHSNRTGKDIRIPRHGSKEIPTGTANRILRDAGLK